MKRIFFLLFALSAFQIFCVSAFAQPQQSENFRITKSVLDAGGGASTSANFRLVSAFGQPTPVGVSSSTNFVLSAGFLSPTFAAAPLSPIQDLVMIRQPASNNMKLDWGTIPGATLYTIYRDVTSNFTPGPGNLLGTSATNTFTDVGAVSLPATKYFYNVTSTSNGGNPAALVPPETVVKQDDSSLSISARPRRSPEPPARAAPPEKQKRSTPK